MGYAVCHRDAAGTLQVDDVASLDAAVEVVERLRNEDGPSDVRVFREVPIEVRTYYKVVVADGETAAAVPAPPAVDAPVAVDVRAEATAEPVTEPVPVLTASPAPSVDPLPGAFPLASPTPPSVVVHDADHDTAGDASRRHSLFSRGG